MLWCRGVFCGLWVGEVGGWRRVGAGGAVVEVAGDDEVSCGGVDACHWGDGIGFG